MGSSGLYFPRGYIVEYGGMPGDPIVNISGSTSIFVPEITSITEGQSCPNESVTLAVAVSEGTAYWYDELNGGNLLNIGDTFTTPTLDVTTTYFVAVALKDV